MKICSGWTTSDNVTHVCRRRSMKQIELDFPIEKQQQTNCQNWLQNYREI
jgi:hypothetical protein